MDWVTVLACQLPPSQSLPCQLGTGGRAAHKEDTKEAPWGFLG